MKRWAAALAAALLAGCGTEPILPDGCYYTQAGIAVLNVTGNVGDVLIPGEVRRVRLTRGRRWRSWRSAYVDVDPGFYLRGAEYPGVSTGTDPEPLPFRFEVDEGESAPLLMATIEAHGHEPLRRGRSCATPPGRR